ncbi:neprilysin-4-like isoform X2 [Lycorma delicatula]|uniref:neprilysin-4-like isoform X2 n=1 Tax=Lycorma delicatula TaxID=130591 RepID=UPI003F519F29
MISSDSFRDYTVQFVLLKHQVWWCANSEKWKNSKCLKLMLTITIILLPVAVVSLSIIKFTNISQKPVNAAPLDFEPSVDFDTDTSEVSRSTTFQYYHTTKCIPTTNGFYTTRTKRNLFHHAYVENDTRDKIVWQIPLQDADVYYLPVRDIKSQNRLVKNNEKVLNNSLIQSNNFEEHLGKHLSGNSAGNSASEKARTLHHINENKESNNSRQESNHRQPKSDEMINVLLDQSNTDELNEGTSSWNKSDHPQEDKGSSVDELSSILQQSFWRYDGDKKATREAQARLMKQYMDDDTDPCHDFYQYACGNWGRLNPIPKDKTNFDTFEKLRESLDFVLKELLEENITENDVSAYIKAKYFYKSCINYEILEKRGDKPLIDLLNSFGGWPMISPEWNSSNFDWIELMAHLRLYNNDILISEWVGPDIKNSNEYVIQFDQTSLGLPTRDYYLQPSNHIYIEAYKNYMTKIAAILGASPESARTQAEEIIDFETDLAKITSASDERRNVSGLYRRMTVGKLKSYIPEVDWQRYLTILLNRPCNNSEPVVIFALRYVQDLVSLIHKTPPRIVANYLLWRFVRHRVNNLDDRYQEAKQQFYYILVGRERAPPRWKYCITQVNSNMGKAVGAMFVRKYFDENSKNDTLSMTKEIQLAFNEILQITNWLGAETKNLAIEKVDTMMLKVGYPDYILSSTQLNDRYKDVNIHPEKYFENTLNLLQHLTRVEQSHLGTAVNKSIWNTAPAIVNAYYSRNKNQIMFPAGILQPPFYHRYFPRSLNYGGIGVVIGHEITHGFDDKGRLFDKFGNLHRWWKDEEIQNFHERAQCLIEQYSKYVVQEVGISLDGINTQGENIADNGGIKQAFRAYQKWLSIHSDEDETLPGMNATGYQLFFLNFAQVWCGNTRPEASKNGLKTAVHSPGKFRVIGTLSNNEDFAHVFQCPVGTPMNPLKKCSVW